MGEVVDWRSSSGATPRRPSCTTTRRPPAPDRVATPPGGRRLQRLGCADPRVVAEDTAAAAAVHQAGRRRVRPAPRSRGYRTATVLALRSGTCPLEKDDTSDWQAYSTTATGLRLRCTGLTTWEGAAHGHPQAHRPASHALEHRPWRFAQRRCGTFFAGRRRVPQPARGAGSGPCDLAEYDDGRPLDSATQVPPAPGRARGAGLRCRPPPSRPPPTLARSPVRNLRTLTWRTTTPQRNVSSRVSGSCCHRSTRRRS
jgi:galactofuranosylgalactofuranosylrhamnosyl-N-acetylglucosaminyl-diphospho-decaprenol beta-1,5/1,6-galactofuranosyltransferase